jgi:hypothetical protein
MLQEAKELAKLRVCIVLDDLIPSELEECREPKQRSFLNSLLEFNEDVIH